MVKRLGNPSLVDVAALELSTGPVAKQVLRVENWFAPSVSVGCTSSLEFCAQSLHAAFYSRAVRSDEVVGGHLC